MSIQIIIMSSSSISTASHMSTNPRMSINPRMYFQINGQCLVPIRSICRALDAKFVDASVIRANVDGYNNYTKEFIKNNADGRDVFWSECYSYDPIKNAFNFYQLDICDDDEYENIFSGSEFDADTEYACDMSDSASASCGNGLLAKIRAEHPCPKISSGFYVEEKNWNYLVRNIMKHQNTLLVGPTGTGKTEIVQRICESLGIACHIYDMGSMQDPLTDLLGSHRLENGSSVFDYAKFVYDVQQPGVILLDELSRAPLMANNILFPCLDGRRTLPVEIADSKNERIIKVHPECTFIATANVGTEYSGTNDIDAALMNRFLPLQLDYMPENIETEVVTVRTGIDKATAKKLVAFVNRVRTENMNGIISKSVSTREVLACADLIADGFTPLEAINFVITNKYCGDNRDGDMMAIRKIIMEF